MSDTDESTPTTPPAGDTSAHPEGAAPATTSPEGTVTKDGDDAADDPRVAALSKEAAAYRRKLRELEAKVAEHERAQMTEAERRQAERDEAKAALDRERAERARERAEARIIAAAAKQKAVDPDAVWAIVRDDAVAKGDDLDADQLVKDALRARPYLVAHPATGSDADPARSHAGPRRESEEQRRARLRGPAASDAFFGAEGGGVRFRTPTT